MKPGFKRKFGFNCMSFNADSLLNKRDELLLLISDRNPDIIAISELLPKNCKNPPQATEFNIPDYEFFSNMGDNPDRGVGLYIKSILKPLEVKVNDNKATDTVWAQVRLCGSDTLLVGSVYRSPNSSQENNDSFNQMFSKASEMNYSHVLVMGDCNHKEIDWKEMTTKCTETHEASKFLEAIRDSYLHQHTRNPTHFRGDQTPNVLDLIFTNEETMINDIDYSAPVGKSHHSTLLFQFKCYKPSETSNIPGYTYDKGDYDTIREKLSEINWDKELEGKNTQDSWTKIKLTVHKLIDNHIPKKRNSNSNRPTKPLWMNDKAMAAIKKKRDSFKRYLQTREGADYQSYAKFRNQAKWETRKAKREYEKHIAKQTKKNPKAFFRYANSKLKTRSGVADLHKEDGSTTKTDQEKAEVLNDFFASVFTRENMSHMPEFSPNNIDSSLENIQITEEKVHKKLKNLNPSKAMGMDGFHPRVLKEASQELSKPLAMLFSKSLEEGYLPDDWKCGQVSPIFKKGSKSSPANYRPVSLTSVVCKQMESIIREELLDHMKPYLSKYQHGFLNGRSCVTQLLDCIGEWSKQLDEGNCLDVIYLDYAKAFDSVPHHRLLKKLEGYGIKGNVLNWITSFLLNRKQRVVINGEASSWRDVLSGIPQGSVLGPVLFICYVNDMPETVQSMIRMFADDTKVFAQCNTEQECKHLQNDLDILQDWAEDWQLRFNATKCKSMHLGHSNKKFTYNMRHNQTKVDLEETQCEKDLGVNVDPSLKFSKHCEKAVNKANQLLGLIRRSFDYIDKESMTYLFKGLVRPHLEYANCVWSPGNKKDSTLVENVQRRATKLVPEVKEFEYEQRLEKLKLPSLVYRRLRGDLIETYKVTHNLYNIDPESYFKMNRDTRTRGHKYKILKQSARLEVRKHYFGLRIVDIWNNLPDAVVEAPSINAFKNRVDKLLADYHYVIDIDTAQVIKDLNKNRSSVNFKDSDLEEAPQD